MDSSANIAIKPPLEIRVLIGIERDREGYCPALWSAHINAQDD
jgi:hypothetical protein